jgi:type IV secretory pathway protease TraF
MKVVVALPGDRVCLDGHDYRVNGRHLAFVRDVDSRGRPLGLYKFCGDVPAGQAFVATPLRSASIVGTSALFLSMP